ncbi:MAG: hypothetical protein MJ225_00990 [Bacilli bacterium]|nr:hypothetical protein [Bacilli bacterium]
MKLSFETIKQISSGYESISLENNLVHFERMKDETINDFTNSDWIREDYEKRSHATCNVVLDFYTNSEFIKIGYKNVKSASSRLFWYIDVLVNNNIIAHHGEEFYSRRSGEFEFKLYETPARVTIYLPCLYKLDIDYIEIDEKSFVKPVQKPIKFLFYGDSITQGYDVRLPSLSYSACKASCIDEKRNYEIT